jgi:uncharacterized membrane protein (GlpM family)
MLNCILYFILGEVIVSLVAYIGSLGKGTLAALIATLPVMTILTFIFVYLESGIEATSSYAKNLLFFTPTWLAYVLTIMFTLERIGIWKSLILGSLAFFIIALTTLSILR